jgi:predicted AlkP superfamily pyrophosphatase or phosphodiesterase
VVVISLDGAQPDLVERYLRTGVLDPRTGLGRLRQHGTFAQQHVPATPSVTAVSHIAIATGSGAPRNGVPLNTFHPVAASIGTSMSGFAAPIGGYELTPLGPRDAPTAVPLWVPIRKAGLRVVAATWPGADGDTIRIGGTVVQAAEPNRTVDYTVPYGAWGGLPARGFGLTRGAFALASPALAGQLAAAGHRSFSPVQATTPVETVFCAPTPSASCGSDEAEGRTLRYDIAVAALDSTDDSVVNYDTLVFFDAGVGVTPGPFVPPATGPARVKARGRSAPFFFESSGNRVGVAFFVSRLDSDLSMVRFARYAASYVARHTPVRSATDDVTRSVGFWAPQPDYRIVQRLAPGFARFPELELEAIYEDQVATFVRYQTRVALLALARNPDANLVMLYIEQPDGSGHQFTLTDPRQVTNPLDARTVGRAGAPPGAVGQDPAKIARYARYLESAYQQANGAVDAILDAIGSRPDGGPARDVLVVSDHGMAPLHTAVDVRGLLSGAGIDVSQIGIRATGPAINVYVNLQGRERGGRIAPADHGPLVASIAGALREATDPNAFYNPERRRLFGVEVWTRPEGCGRPGFCTDAHVGQDSGDVVALMIEGYSADGIQRPPVARLGDGAAASAVYSIPGLYGAHGHDPRLRSMSAILYAAGPHIAPGHPLTRVHAIDIAPTILAILGVPAPATIEGQVLKPLLRRRAGD